MRIKYLSSVDSMSSGTPFIRVWDAGYANAVAPSTIRPTAAALNARRRRAGWGGGFGVVLINPGFATEIGTSITFEVVV
jgi:hypothetical protein